MPAQIVDGGCVGDPRGGHRTQLWRARVYEQHALVGDPGGNPRFELRDRLHLSSARCLADGRVTHQGATGEVVATRYVLEAFVGRWQEQRRRVRVAVECQHALRNLEPREVEEVVELTECLAVRSAMACRDQHDAAANSLEPAEHRGAAGNVFFGRKLKSAPRKERLRWRALLAGRRLLRLRVGRRGEQQGN